jgi:hypothetical protein
MNFFVSFTFNDLDGRTGSGSTFFEGVERLDKPTVEWMIGQIAAHNKLKTVCILNIVKLEQ